MSHLLADIRFAVRSFLKAPVFTAVAIASLAMLLQHSLHQPAAAAAIERALESTLAAGHRTADLGGASAPLGTTAFTGRVIAAL